MKNTIILFILFFLGLSGVFANQADNSIQKELDKQINDTKESSGDFSLKTFSSCSAMDEIMDEYIKNYWKNKPQRNYYYNDIVTDNIMEDSLNSNESQTEEFSKASNVS